MTAEGPRSRRAPLHPVQREMAVRGGSQCGYCTPGFVCSMAAEFYRAGRLPADQDDGTTRRARRARCQRLRPARAQRQPVPLHRLPADQGRRVRARRAGRRRRRSRPAATSRRRRRPPRPGCTPARRRARPAGRPGRGAAAPARRSARGRAWSRARTDWGVEVNLRGRRAALVVAIDRLPELRGLSVGDDEIRLGAALTLTEIERRLDGRLPLLAELFPQFASPADPQRRDARRQPRHRLADR